MEKLDNGGRLGPPPPRLAPPKEKIRWIRPCVVLLSIVLTFTDTPQRLRLLRVNCPKSKTVCHRWDGESKTASPSLVVIAVTVKIQIGRMTMVDRGDGEEVVWGRFWEQ